MKERKSIDCYNLPLPSNTTLHGKWGIEKGLTSFLYGLIWVVSLSMGSTNFKRIGTRYMLFYFFLFFLLEMFLFCFISHQVPDTWRVCRWAWPYCLKQSEQDGQQSSLTSITIFMKKIDHVYTFIGICIDYMRAAFFDTTPNIAVRKSFLFDLTQYTWPWSPPPQISLPSQKPPLLILSPLNFFVEHSN